MLTLIHYKIILQTYHSASSYAILAPRPTPCDIVHSLQYLANTYIHDWPSNRQVSWTSDRHSSSFASILEQGFFFWNCCTRNVLSTQAALKKMWNFKSRLNSKSSLIEWLKYDLWPSVHIVLSGMKSMFAIMQDASKGYSYKKQETKTLHKYSCILATTILTCNWQVQISKYKLLLLHHEKSLMCRLVMI